MKNSIRLVGILLCFHFSAFSQEGAPLTIGDTLPKLTIANVINHAEKTITLGTNKGKAIVLDFGTTACSPCIKSLLVLDSLKKAFPDDLEVFMVTNEKTSRVRKFLEQNPIGKSVEVPIITEDSVLHTLFRHVVQPHEVWIDKSMVTKAFTDHHYLTMENVRALVAGENIEWPVKWDFPYDYNCPIVVLNEENIPPLAIPRQWHSTAITGHMTGVRSRQYTKVDSASATVKVGAINMSLAKIYASRFKRYWNTSFFPSQVLSDMEPTRLMYVDGFGYEAEWNERNTYCYEMTFPLSVPEEERNWRIIQQLNWYFGVEVSLERIVRSCWVLKNSEADHVNVRADSQHKGGYRIQNLKIIINRIPEHPPLIDELDIDDKARYSRRMVISDEAFANLPVLNADLEPYGIHVVEEERVVETLIIKKLTDDNI